MADRLAPLSQPPDIRPRSTHVPPRKLALPDWKALLSSAESFIAKNPGATLASAFVIGAAIAWWIKRK
jgi:hypothetical protein